MKKALCIAPLLLLAAAWGADWTPSKTRAQTAPPTPDALLAQVRAMQAKPVSDAVDGISLPDKVVGQPGAFIRVPATTTGAVVRWKSPDSGLNLFPVDLLKDSKTAIVIGNTAGTYRLWAWTAGKDGAPTEAAECLVIVGKGGPTPKPPTPDPKPKPKPPDPKPKPPTPDVVPIPGPGLHVLMVYDEKKKTEMSSQHQAILFGKTVTDYLTSKCPVSKGPEGDAYEWRVYGAGFDLSADSKTWKDAMARPRTSLPWIVIGVDNKRGFEGPLPATVEETMTLLKKYGG